MNADNAHDLELDAVEWVALKRCRLSEVHPLKLHLDAAGIELHILEESWVDDDAVVSVHVPSTRIETARQILGSLERAAQPEVHVIGGDDSRLPLSWGIRIVAFLLPLVAGLSLMIVFVVQANYVKRGFRRRGEEWCWWYVGGFFFWIAVLITVVIMQ